MEVALYKLIYLCLLTFLGFGEAGVLKNQLPSPRIEAIFPKGLRVTLPDNDYFHFEFHGKLNKEMNDLEDNDWSGESFSPVNGIWTFLDREALLKLGDKIYYKIIVDKDGKNNLEKSGVHIVTDCSFLDE